MIREWKVKTLGECVRFLSGGTPSKSNPSYWTDAGVPWLSAKDMKRFRVADTKDHITLEGIDNGTKVVRAGTVFLLIRGMTLLKSIPICVALREMAFNQDVKALVPDSTLLHESYVPYLLLGRKTDLLSMVDLAGHGTGRLNSSSLKAFEVVLPPLPEQRRIAAMLRALDDKIELNRQMNRTLEEMAQAIFKSWFIDFDGHTDLVDSELGPIPKDWRVGRLSDLSTSVKGAITGGPFGSNLTRRDYVSRGVPVIRGGNLLGHDGWFKDGDFVFVSEAKAESLRTNLASQNDVVFTQRGTLGQVGLIPKNSKYPTYVISQSQMKMTCADWVPPEFIYLFFKTASTIAYIAANATSSGVPHINLGFLRAFPLVIPSRTSLARFASIVAPIHARIVQSVDETVSLAELRDALLPKLISGEIRVPEAEDAVEATA